MLKYGKCIYVVENVYEYEEGGARYFSKRENAKAAFYEVLELAREEIIKKLNPMGYADWEWSDLKLELWEHNWLVEEFVLYYTAFIEDEE